MSTPTFRGLGRMTLISFGIAGLYIVLDTVVPALGTRAITWWSWRSALSADVAAHAREIAAAAAAHPSALRPELRRAAWRLGVGFGVASQARHRAAITGDSTLANSATEVLREYDGDARALGLAPISALAGNSIAEAASLTQRVEDDEAKIAALVSAATTDQHRHLFLAGAHSGLEWVLRVTPGAPEANFGGPLIAKHSRLASLDAALWQPLADPPGADPTQRRAAFLAAFAAIDQALAKPNAR